MPVLSCRAAEAEGMVELSLNATPMAAQDAQVRCVPRSGGVVSVFVKSLYSSQEV